MPKSKHTPVSWFSGSRHSVHSAGEGSETALSETEEINEVNALKDKADAAFEEGNYEEALTLYNEALEIDRSNVEVLASKTAVFIDTGDFIAAQKEAEILIGAQEDYPQGHYLLGIALEQLGQHKAALRSFLKSLNCDSQHGDILSDNIAAMVIRVCKLPLKTLEKFEAMDPYTKLCEMGSLLYLAKKYELCIQVLETAQKLETNQQGIQMKILFTMANAQSALKCTDIAISLYQDCLTVALSAHDPQYQTKALVNLASLSMDSEDIHQAIIYYERLLDLETELRGSGENQRKDGGDLPEYWTPELQVALYLNLSIAYKSIGKLKQALLHAEHYVALVNKHGHDIGEEAESHYHVGMLYEMLQNYDEATKHFKTYLAISKKQGDRKGVGHAYGLLGRCSAELHNWQLAITYHEQHLAIGRKLKNSKVIALATELLGDTYMDKGDYDHAVTAYEEMHKNVLKNLKERCKACCKLAKAFQLKKRHQYALFYYEEAQQIVSDFDFEEFTTDIEFNSALILQHSTQHSELEQARKYFERLIPGFEDKAQQMMDEEMSGLDEMRSQLSQCYDGMQNVLCKLGVKDECLQYSECHKKMKLLSVKNHNPLTSRCLSRMTNVHGANLDMWTIEKITRVVNEQNATVLYYTVLPGSLLIWVLQPGKGLVRFYSTRPPSKDVTFNQLIKGLCEELCSKGRDFEQQQYECENRALPLKTTELSLKRQANEKKSRDQTSHKEEHGKVPEKGSALSEPKEEDVFPSRNKTLVKSPQRRLFDMLLSPVADILSELETGSSIVIIPDKELYQCPFPILEDWSNVQVSKKYSFTIVPSLMVLEKVTQNVIDSLRSQDELEFERAKSCLGGMSRLLTEEEISRSNRDLHLLLGTSNGYNSGADLDCIDPRRTSNPRLLKSGALIPPPMTPSTSLPAFSRESTFLSMASKSTALPSPPLTPNLKAIKTIGAPTSLDRMLHAGSLTTLTTRTSTGTDIVSSTDWVPEFQQISDTDRCVVFGNPKLPDRLQLNGKEWQPPFELSEAQKEVYAVADYCDVITISGEEATKERFLKEMQTATVLHIATFGCLKEGFLVFSPNPAREDTGGAGGVPKESSYLVTTEDIINCTMCAKLVVLSCGWSSHSRDYVDVGMALPSALLAAGAHCVLTLLWSVPNHVLEKFYYHFYSALQTGCLLSTAVNTAVEEVKKEKSDISYWAPFTLVGKDGHVSLHHVHEAMLHQKVDKVEKEVLQNLKKDVLNPKPLTPNVAEKEENMQTLQEKLLPLLCHHGKQPQVVEHLIDLLDDALKRIHTDEKDQKISVLSEVIVSSKGGLDLLHYLGFHFQPRGSLLKDPYVVFPHASLDELLMSAFITLRAVSEMGGNVVCLHTLYEFLPVSQKNVSHIIDMLAITKHAPELQLKVSDLSVRPLWLNPKSKALLGSIGLHQVGMLLAFNGTSSNRKLLDAFLKFFLAISTYKSPVLMHKLDVALLGTEGSSKVSGAASSESIRLPTLTPMILPRNTPRSVRVIMLHMSTPWACNVENTDEMKEKMRLARSKSELGTDFHKQLERAKTWHQMTVKSQGDQSLEKAVRPKPKQAKVKVVQSQNKRVPVDYEPPLGVLEVDQRRDYAHFILHQRVDNISLRHRDSVKKLYLPYVQNM